MSPDDLLARSAPPTTPASDELDRRLAELVDGTRLAAEPRTARRSRRGVAVAGALAVGLVGVGTAAAASGLLPTLLPWSSDGGTSCELAVEVALRTDADGRPLDGSSPAEARASLSSAQAYVDELDVADIDRGAAAEAWFSHQESISVGSPTREELEAVWTGERLEVHAVMHAVGRGVDEHLRAEGHEPRDVATTVANRCG